MNFSENRLSDCLTFLFVLVFLLLLSMLSTGSSPAATAAADDASKMEIDEVEKKMSAEEEELMEMSTEEIVARTRALDNSMRERKSEMDRINREITTLRGRIKENEDKIVMGKQLPFLVSTVVELVPDCEAGIEDAINAGVAKPAQKKKPAAPVAQNGLLPMKKALIPS